MDDWDPQRQRPDLVTSQSASDHASIGPNAPLNSKEIEANPAISLPLVCRGMVRAMLEFSSTCPALHESAYLTIPLWVYMASGIWDPDLAALPFSFPRSHRIRKYAQSSLTFQTTTATQTSAVDVSLRCPSSFILTLIRVIGSFRYPECENVGVRLVILATFPIDFELILAYLHSIVSRPQY